MLPPMIHNLYIATVDYLKTHVSMNIL